jgi:hypothetical protein
VKWATEVGGAAAELINDGNAGGFIPVFIKFGIGGAAELRLTGGALIFYNILRFFFDLKKLNRK